MSELRLVWLILEALTGDGDAFDRLCFELQRRRVAEETM
jgi:hypothetical protein